jgi:hypothetical protein
MGNGLIISVEVIHLLKWIMEHGQEDLNSLVTKAINHGCLDIDENARFDSAKNLADFQQVILSVVASLERSVDKYAAGSGNIAPAVEMLMERLWGCNLDPDLIINSVRMTSLNLGKSTKSNGTALPAQEDILQSIFANLLKKWKPGKKDTQA